MITRPIIIIERTERTAAVSTMVAPRRRRTWSRVSIVVPSTRRFREDRSSGEAGSDPHADFAGEGRRGAEQPGYHRKLVGHRDFDVAAVCVGARRLREVRGGE